MDTNHSHHKLPVAEPSEIHVEAHAAFQAAATGVRFELPKAPPRKLTHKQLETRCGIHQAAVSAFPSSRLANSGFCGARSNFAYCFLEQKRGIGATGKWLTNAIWLRFQLVLSHSSGKSPHHVSEFNTGQPSEGLRGHNAVGALEEELAL